MKGGGKVIHAELHWQVNKIYLPSSHLRFPQPPPSSLPHSVFHISSVVLNLTPNDNISFLNYSAISVSPQRHPWGWFVEAAVVSLFFFSSGLHWTILSLMTFPQQWCTREKQGMRSRNDECNLNGWRRKCYNLLLCHSIKQLQLLSFSINRKDGAPGWDVLR